LTNVDKNKKWKEILCLYVSYTCNKWKINCIYEKKCRIWKNL